MRLQTFLLLTIFSVSAFSMQLGGVVLAGNGCFGSTKLIAVNSEQGRYALPLRAKANKKSTDAFARTTCNMRLPITVAANEKVQLINLSQVVRVVAFKGAQIKTNLNLGFVGKNAPPLTYDKSISEDEFSNIENLKSDGVLAESACGKNTMLTGNLSLIVSGSAAQAFVSTGTALLSLKVVRCNQ